MLLKLSHKVFLLTKYYVRFMTEDQLKQLLNGEDIHKRLDLKSLVLDLLKNKSTKKEILDIFYQKLPDLNEAYVKRFIFMKRHN
mgnify:CR=1 FL=1